MGGRAVCERSSAAYLRCVDTRRITRSSCDADSCIPGFGAASVPAFCASAESCAWGCDHRSTARPCCPVDVETRCQCDACAKHATRSRSFSGRGVCLVGTASTHGHDHVCARQVCRRCVGANPLEQRAACEISIDATTNECRAEWPRGVYL